MTMPPTTQRLWTTALALAVAAIAGVSISVAEEPRFGAYISTGDNQWVGSWLPIDSKASIEASIEFLSRLGVKRIYWRGLQGALYVDTARERKENVRYDSFWQWTRKLYAEVDPDRTAAEAAHRRGIEFWGVSALFDWGSQADTPCFGDFPHPDESRLRQEHPEWVPVDRRGVLRQGGPIELAYPDARKALVDLHLKYVRRDGYDGVLFLTYAENYSTRFQDEFGYNEPVVAEFKRRTGVDLRTQSFNRTGSRYDWYALRGEYVTEFLRELKGELARDGKRLGMFINPQQPHFPQPWNVPELILTGGHISLDLETWVRNGLIDHLLVYGYCHPDRQNAAIENCLWLVRGTTTTVGCLTSSPYAERMVTFRDRRVPIVIAVGEERQYLEASNLPALTPAALKSDDSFLRIQVLAQIMSGQVTASAAEIEPLTRDENLLARRLALLALGNLQDPANAPILEQGLLDAENGVRCAAAIALSQCNRPESVAKLLAAVDRFSFHPLADEAVNTLLRMNPFPREELASAAQSAPNPVVRAVAMRALALSGGNQSVEALVAGLRDADRAVRFYAALGLGNTDASGAAVDALIGATCHEDPVVSDRAATSLGILIQRSDRQAQENRAKIAEALKSLYSQLGDNCQRSDAEWGYRPVGNALLKLGAEGEQILYGFLHQTNDRRLADQAWRSLYVRQDNGTFSEVTEQENDAAFAHRPEWLDRHSSNAEGQN